LLFRLLHWSPEEYYKMSTNARVITRAFLQRMVQDLKEEAEEIKG